PGVSGHQLLNRGLLGRRAWFGQMPARSAPATQGASLVPGRRCRVQVVTTASRRFRFAATAAQRDAAGREVKRVRVRNAGKRGAGETFEAAGIDSDVIPGSG